jgi:hypothetical protein
MGNVNDLEKVRVELGSLSAKREFSPTRTCGRVG